MSTGTTFPVPYRLAAIVAVYVAYLLATFVLGSTVFNAQDFYWDDGVVIALTGIVLVRTGWRSAPPMRQFLLANALATLFLLVSDVSYGQDPSLWRANEHDGLQLTNVAYAVFLFIWICTWGLLVLALARRRPPSGRTVTVFAILMGGFVLLFGGFYLQLYQNSLATFSGRLDVALAVLELAAVVTGLAAMLLGVSYAMVLQVFGLTMLAAADMMMSEASARHIDFAAADPVWMLGLCLLLAGAVVHPRGQAVGASDRSSLGGSHRSGLSTLLLSLSLGSVLLSAVIGVVLRRGVEGRAVTPSSGEPFFFLLFVVGLVVVMVWLTDRFDRAVSYTENYATQLMRQHLRAGSWRDAAHHRLVWILEATGLGQVLDALQRASLQLRNDVLFLGPERLNPPQPDTPVPAKPTCFIVMPFGLAESDGVHQVLRQVCLSAHLQPVRGDDLFTPTDILDDIWRGIAGAHCVIADITGRNPNVMYELGMAHTLAKPVLILSRHADDIPIDLATRRVILYGTAAGDAGHEWQAQLAQRAQTAIHALMAQYPAGK